MKTLDEIKQMMAADETFKRIHDELTPEMEKLEKKEPKAETVSLWKKCRVLWMSLIVGVLVLVGVWTGSRLGKDDKRATSVFSLNIQNIRQVPVKGRYVTGCGCGCDNCTYRWFMRDDINYTLPWHPGKCNAEQCTCPCEHSRNHH